MKCSDLGPALVFCLLLGSLGSGQSISWIEGTVGPTDWMISPVSPGSGDVIHFTGPTNLYANSCAGEQSLGGTPWISIDHFGHVIELHFQPPAPTVCALIWQPVSGLEGNFGPLAPGSWLFRSTVSPIAFSLPFTVAAAPSPALIYVDDNAPGPVHDGSNWARAYRYLQDALASAFAGDEIRVAQGVYQPDRGVTVVPGDRAASFALKDGVVMRGGYAGWPAAFPDLRDPDAHETLLSGDLQGDDQWGILNRHDNSYHVVTARGLVLPTTEVDGFHIAGGEATAPHPQPFGAGVLIENAGPRFKNCHIHHNVAGFGGGVSNLQGAPAFINCRISGNRAIIYGGGIYCYEGSVSLTNCLVTGNASDQAETAGGSAIHNLGGSMELECCTVADNRAPQGHAIVSLAWVFPPTKPVRVENSILYNGGDEILTNHGGTVVVQYSDIWGGWSGSGNIDADPLFERPGLWSIEGEWIVGDYTLQAPSPCGDSGSNGLLPADFADMDEDGVLAEALPIDLDGIDRIQGGRVDMGCYERAVVLPPSPPPLSWIPVASININLNISQGTPSNVSANVPLTIELNFVAELSLDIQPASPAGGTWTAMFSPDPGPVGPGEVTVHVQLLGVNLDAGQLNPGPSQKVAELTILARPF